MRVLASASYVDLFTHPSASTSANSMPKMGSQKRKRTPADDDSLEDDDEESSPQSARLRRDLAQLSSDDSMSEGSENSSDDEMPGNSSQFSKKANKAAENGILESVICENFMCHTHLEVALGPLINFIIGHNGSGKSAVLTAITLCLGGKATATNRGQNLKSFIKEGQESTILTVKIKNRSDSAYQHEVYGNTIIVERHFSRAGSSNFKLKSATGRLVSNRKADLDEICDYFALQIDNPMNVLTQDMARQFLNNSTPIDKYRFFFKGTQLEALDADYLLIEQSINQITLDLGNASGDVKDYEEAAKKAQALLVLAEQQDTLRERIKGFGDQMAWAQVEEQEAKVLNWDNQLSEAAEKIEVTKAEEAKVTDSFEAAHQALHQVNAAVNELKEGLVPILEEKDQAKKISDNLKAEALKAQAEQRQIKDYLKRAEANVIKTTGQIQEEHRRLEEENGGSHKKRLDEIEKGRADLLVAKNRLQEHENGFGQLEMRRKAAATEHDTFQGPITAKRDEIMQHEDRLSNLMRDRGHQQGAYKPSMPRLLHAIQQDSGFLERPVGPMGSHVRLMKPSWSSILEKSFGAALETFIVTSKQDQSRLSTLMQKVGCVCPILIGNNAPMDTSTHEPDSSFETTLRVLEIDNDLVRKQLVINQGIEQTVLTEMRDDGVAALEGPNQHKVKQCFTLNKKAGSGLRLSLGYGGGLVQSYIEPFRGVPRMKTDLEYQINSERDILQRLNSELGNMEQQQRDKKANIRVCDQAIASHRKETSNLRVVVQRAESIVDKLQDALDNDAVEEGRLEALKTQLLEAQNEVTNHEGSYEDSVIALDKVRESMRVSRHQMKVLDERVLEAEVKIRMAESEATKLSDKREAALKNKNAAVEAAKKAVLNKTLLEPQRKAQFETLTQFLGEANAICRRVPVDPGETSESLEKKQKKLHDDLVRYEARIGGNKFEIAEKAAKAELTYRQVQQELDNLNKLRELLTYTLQNRRERWKYFKIYIVARARTLFFHLLNNRGFRGRLLVNHKQRKLDLVVEPDETKTGQGRQTKTLSGGEKSFSTICLLLSLWEAMGAPIRCLDEFDVFMDSVNRDVSMKMMISAAREAWGRQFILITPQSMGPVFSDRDVKIIKLSDPERGQTALSFSPAAAAAA